MGFITVNVPDTLHVAVYRLVHAEEFLKLINEQGYRAVYGKFHYKFKYVCKMFSPPYCRYSQLIFDFKLIVLA